MRRYYCDHNATTPLHPEAAAAVLSALGAGAGDPEAGRAGTAGFGNPSSIHWAGREARNLVESAREALAGMLDVHPSEIIFTSGGTEADNLAILGSTASGRLRGRHVIAAAFEHPAVLEPFRKLESEGWEVTWIDPDAAGVVSSEAVAAALRPETGLVSVMAANNETGAIQPTAAIGAMLRPRGILFHCDGVQALGKIPQVRPREWGVDYMAFSAHKINGPKGAGALYVRKGAPLQGLLLGGPQERRNRGGTENVPGIAGFGRAAEAWVRGGAEERDRLALLRDGLERALGARIPDLIVNSAEAPRLPGTLNATLPGCKSDLMVMGLDMRGVAVSAGSACASGSVKYSHVLLAMGKGREAASSSLRFSLGAGNSVEDLEPIAEIVSEVAASVRGL